MWIKFHKKKIVEIKNIAKTTKTKYTITKFWWWNFKIKFETILEWENLSVEKSFEWKKNGKVFQNYLKINYRWAFEPYIASENQPVQNGSWQPHHFHMWTKINSSPTITVKQIMQHE